MFRKTFHTHTRRLARKCLNSSERPVFDGSCALKLENEAESTTFSHRDLMVNAIGNRISKKIGTTTTFYLTDENNPTGFSQVVEEKTQNGTSQPTLTTVYIYGLDLISKRDIGSGDVMHYGYDGHGSVRFLTDNSGNRTDNYDYDAFGILINSDGTTQNNYRYAGEQFDGDLGLYYNRARYLDVERGRFFTLDPLVVEIADINDPLFPENILSIDPRLLHTFVYGLGDPVNIADASGLSPLFELQISNIVRENMVKIQAAAFRTFPSAVGNVISRTRLLRLTGNQINSLSKLVSGAQRQLLKKLFTKGNAQGLTRDTLKIYRTLARENIKRGGNGVIEQVRRLELIEKALKLL